MSSSSSRPVASRRPFVIRKTYYLSFRKSYLKRENLCETLHSLGYRMNVIYIFFGELASERTNNERKSLFLSHSHSPCSYLHPTRSLFSIPAISSLRPLQRTAAPRIPTISFYSIKLFPRPIAQEFLSVWCVLFAARGEKTLLIFFATRENFRVRSRKVVCYKR